MQEAFRGALPCQGVRKSSLPGKARGFRGQDTVERHDGLGVILKKTDHLREVVEAALAHTVHNQVEAAYRRSDLFERRRGLMQYWEAYVAGESWNPEAGRIR